MKIFTFHDICELRILPAQCYDWVSEMILHKKEAFLPAKILMNREGNIFCNVMPCFIPDGERT